MCKKNAVLERIRKLIRKVPTKCRGCKNAGFFKKKYKYFSDFEKKKCKKSKIQKKFLKKTCIFTHTLTSLSVFNLFF